MPQPDATDTDERTSTNTFSPAVPTKVNHAFWPAVVTVSVATGPSGVIVPMTSVLRMTRSVIEPVTPAPGRATTWYVPVAGSNVASIEPLPWLRQPIPMVLESGATRSGTPQPSGS